MASSVVNAEKRNIRAGMAVAASGNFGRLASSTVLASAVATDGAAPGGVLGIQSSGILALNDWTASTGSKSLTPGATYYAADGGMLLTTGGQQIGQAVSYTELLLNIAQSAHQFTVLPTVTQSTPVQKTLTFSGPPPPQLGNKGDFCVDTKNSKLYGPKTSGSWGAPLAFVT